MKQAFDGIYSGMRVMVTGHTGFKGSWLAIWLRELGAEVIGYSLSVPTVPSNFSVTGLESKLTHICGDVRDYEKLRTVINEYNPQVIFHLAAQPLVLYSYSHPKETFDVNVGGTVNILEATRHSPSVRAVVAITTDKVYDNKEWLWGYRENDTLGGNDPYSASKAMAELTIASYRKSFFSFDGAPTVASVRAGNVIGGGDFAEYRLVPDVMKALMHKIPIEVRNPASVRPWVHVLDPLSGYLLIAQKLLTGERSVADAWNLGPLEQQGVTCKRMVEKAIELWGDGDWVDTSDVNAKAEMKLLKLNWDKAANTLGWRPTYSWEEALEETVAWFKAFSSASEEDFMYRMCVEHIQSYLLKASELQLDWTGAVMVEERQ